MRPVLALASAALLAACLPVAAASLGCDPAPNSQNAGIIYATGSKEIRRVICPDTDIELRDPRLIGQGESILVVARTTIAAPGNVELAVLAATGMPPLDPTAAVVDGTGNVMGVIAADPAIDTLPDKSLTLVPAFAGVEAGDTYDAATKMFTAPIKVTVMPKGTIDRFTGRPSLANVTITTGGPLPPPKDNTAPVLLNVLNTPASGAVAQ